MNTWSTAWVRCLVVAAGVFAVSSTTSLAPALAQARDAASKEDLERAEAKAMEAKFKFKAGEHEAAARLFLEAFAISRRPALVFNAARAFEDAGRLREAKAAFEQYLTLAGVSEGGRAEARSHIETLTTRIDAATRAAKAEPAAAAPQPPLTTGTPAMAASPAMAVSPAATTPATSTTPVATTAAKTARTGPVSNGDKTWLNWGLFGGGSGLALLGVLTYAGAVQKAEAANTMDFAKPGAKVSYSAAFDAAESSRDGAVFIGLVGAGLAAWGGYRLFGSPEPSPTRAAGLWGAPIALGGPGGQSPGVMIGGQF